MEKKSIFIIIMVSILIILFGSLMYGNIFNQENRIKVGDSFFTIPHGFEEGKFGDSFSATIQNESSSIGIKEYPDNNITKYVQEYIDSNDEGALKTSNFTFNSIPIYKSYIIDDARYVHYWFINNDKVYTVYSWDGNNDTESIVLGLIKNVDSK